MKFHVKDVNGNKVTQISVEGENKKSQDGIMDLEKVQVATLEGAGFKLTPLGDPTAEAKDKADAAAKEKADADAKAKADEEAKKKESEGGGGGSDELAEYETELKKKSKAELQDIAKAAGIENVDQTVVKLIEALVEKKKSLQG